MNVPLLRILTRLALFVSVAGCPSPDEPECYATEPVGPGDDLYDFPCGLTEEQMGMQLLASACYPSDACPGTCDLDRLAGDIAERFNAEQETLTTNADLVEPVCRESTAEECCFHAFVRADNSPGVVD